VFDADSLFLNCGFFSIAAVAFLGTVSGDCPQAKKKRPIETRIVMQRIRIFTGFPSSEVMQDERLFAN